METHLRGGDASPRSCTQLCTRRVMCAIWYDCKTWDKLHPCLFLPALLRYIIITVLGSRICCHITSRSSFTVFKAQDKPSESNTLFSFTNSPFKAVFFDTVRCCMLQFPPAPSSFSLHISPAGGSSGNILNMESSRQFVAACNSQSEKEKPLEIILIQIFSAGQQGWNFFAEITKHCSSQSALP